jgi:hypothetical protein
MNHLPSARTSLVGGLLALLLAACAGTPPTPTPAPTTPPPTASPSASPSPSPTAPSVTSAAQAAALVFAADPRFAALVPASGELVGACCTYQAVDAPAGYTVSISIGWGDCEAGCISHHEWQFLVATDGSITLNSEQGDANPPSPTGEGPTAQVTLHLQAGPTCPVEPAPPATGCPPRIVANAAVIVRSPTGAVLATVTSDADGTIVLPLAPGAYYVEPQPVTGLPGTASAIAFSVVGGQTIDLSLDYDTGIR